MQHNEAQRLIRALSDCHEGAHFQFRNIFGSQHLAFDMRKFGQRPRRACQKGRSGVVGGPVGPFLGKFDARHRSNGAVKNVLDIRRRGQAHDNALNRPALGFGLACGKHVTGVCNSRHSGPNGVVRRCACKADSQLFEVGCLDCGHGRSKRLAHLPGGTAADASEHKTRTGQSSGTIESKRFSRFGLQITRLQCLCDKH